MHVQATVSFAGTLLDVKKTYVTVVLDAKKSLQLSSFIKGDFQLHVYHSMSCITALHCVICILHNVRLATLSCIPPCPTLPYSTLPTPPHPIPSQAPLLPCHPALAHPSQIMLTYSTKCADAEALPV